MNDKSSGSHSGWRLHTHFDIDRHVPTRIEVSRGCNSGHNDEKNRLRTALQPDHCYVMDRWFAQYTLWNEIVAGETGGETGGKPVSDLNGTRLGRKAGGGLGIDK